MTTSDFSILLESLATGWTTCSYQKVTEHFADGLFYSDSLNYVFRDKQALVRFFEDDNGDAQSCEFHDWVFDEVRQRGAAEYTYQGTYRYHGTVWIELANDKIVSWREYQHKSAEPWKDFWNK